MLIAWGERGVIKTKAESEHSGNRIDVVFTAVEYTYAIINTLADFVITFRDQEKVQEYVYLNKRKPRNQ